MTGTTALGNVNVVVPDVSVPVIGVVGTTQLGNVIVYRQALVLVSGVQAHVYTTNTQFWGIIDTTSESDIWTPVAA